MVLNDIKIYEKFLHKLINLSSVFKLIVLESKYEINYDLFNFLCLFAKNNLNFFKENEKLF